MSRLVFLLIVFFCQKEVFSLNKDSIFFNKKSFSSYLSESGIVLLPSAVLIGGGFLSAFLIQKILNKVLSKKYEKINKNIVRTIYGLLILPGLTYFLRCGFWNLIRVFTRTIGFNPYEKGILRIKQRECDKGNNFNAEHNKKTLFIYTHGTGCPGWTIDEETKKHIKEDFETNSYYCFYTDDKDCPKNIRALIWRGDTSNETMRLTGERLSSDIEQLVKKEEYEKVVFVGHSNGGRVMIEAASVFSKNNINTPIDIVTFSTPMNDDIASKLNDILKNEKNKWIVTLANTDFVAQFDPFGGNFTSDGDFSWKKFGTGVSDHRYFEKFNHSENIVIFMPWVEKNGILSKTDHANYVWGDASIIEQKQKKPFFRGSFFYFYKEVMDHFYEYADKKNAFIIQS
jgi:hypothetical protein